MIPHTSAVTTLGLRAVGAVVNIEVDILAKHIERLVSPYTASDPGSEPAPDPTWAVDSL